MPTGIKIATATDEKLLRQLVLLNNLMYNKMAEEPTPPGMGQGEQLVMEPADVAAAAATEVK